MEQYNNKKPLALPVHALRCTVKTEIGDDTSEHTFTVARSKIRELLALLVDVDFQQITIVPITFEFKNLHDFMSLGGPLCPVGVSADTSDQVAFVSLWNEESGRVKEVKDHNRYLSELLMLLKDAAGEDERALTRSMLVDRVDAAVKAKFNKIIIFPKEQSETDEIPSTVDERMKKFADMFDAVDIDHSGEIVLEELRIVLKQKGYSDDFVEHIFCHLDIDKDFRIRRDEFYEALKFIPGDIFSSDKALSDDHLLRYFDDFDTEKKGEVSWAQFHEALIKRGLTDSFIKTYFAQMDLDSSKALTRNEYKRCIGLRWTSE